jgi:hypothetical protein
MPRHCSGEANICTILSQPGGLPIRRPIEESSSAVLIMAHGDSMAGGELPLTVFPRSGLVAKAQSAPQRE